MSIILDHHTLNKLAITSLSDGELVSQLQKLKNTFVGDRSKIEGYGENPKLVSAYTQFYLPTNFPKFDFVLKNVRGDFREDLLSTPFVDFGPGPGTYSLAFLDQERKLTIPKMALIDKSKLMLNQAQKILSHYFPQVENIYYFNDALDAHDFKNQTLFFGNVLNEIGLPLGLKWIDFFTPKYLFVISPGTKDSFKMILSLREEMLQRNYQSLFPCHQLEGPCPLNKKNPDDWCHQILHTTHHPEIEALSQKAKFDRRTLPLIAHLYVKKEFFNEKKNDDKRLVRFLRETKHSFMFEVCSLDESSKQLKIVTIELPKKELSKDLLKSMKKINVGVNLSVEYIKELGPDLFRVKFI